MHEIIREFGPIGRHGIHAGYCAQCDSIVKCPFITHHSDSAVSQKYCACLPYSVIEFPFPKTVYEYGIGLLKDSYLFGGDLSYYTYCQARSRERMTSYQMLRYAQTTAYCTDLVLEQPLERFTELEAHLLRQSADIVMALDCLAGNIQTFNTIRIYGTLSQPFGILNP